MLSGALLPGRHDRRVHDEEQTGVAGDGRFLTEAAALLDAGADALLIGDDRFGMRLAGHFSLEDTAAAVEMAHARGRKVYAGLGGLMPNRLLDELPAYIKAIAEIGVDAAEFGDPAVLAAARREAPGFKLHWNAEMTSTNFATANYWGAKALPALFSPGS